MKTFWKGIYFWPIILVLTISGSVHSGGESDEEKATREKEERTNRGSYTSAGRTVDEKIQNGTTPTDYGRIKGAFKVSTKTGNAEYSIPISAAGGFKGLSPNISLSYSSGGINGLVGVGWSLGGYPVITRCGRNSSTDVGDTFTEEYSGKVCSTKDFGYRDPDWCARRSWGVCKDWRRGTWHANIKTICTNETKTRQQTRAINIGVTLGVNDQLCYNGVRLKLKRGKHGEAGAEYRLLTDRWTKVVIDNGGSGGGGLESITKGPLWSQSDANNKCHNWCGSNKTWTGHWWTTKAGKESVCQCRKASGPGNCLDPNNNSCRMTVYASTGKRTEFTSNNSDKRSFFPSKTYDLRGNQLEYVWDNSVGGTGSTLLWKIKYTSNPKTGREASRQIMFKYALRPDKMVAFKGGLMFQTKRRLSKIETHHRSGSSTWLMTNRYYIRYKQSKSTERSLVRGVQLCDGRNSEGCLPETKFDYGAPRDGAKLFSTDGGTWKSNGGHYDSKAPKLIGDVNGDGLPDLIWVDMNSEDCKRGTFNTGKWYQEAPKGQRCASSNCGYRDINNLDKVCTAFSNGKNNFGASKCTCVLNDEKGYNPAYSVGDVNGDGKTDLIYFSSIHKDMAQHRVMVARGSDNGFEAFTIGKTENNETTLENHRNTWGKQHQFIYRDAVQKDQHNERNAAHWKQNHHARTVGDFNGDGILDMLGFAEKHVYVSLGTKTSSGKATLEEPAKWFDGMTKGSGGWQDDKYPRLTGDVNGDGLADLIGFGDKGVYVAINNGKTFGEGTTWTSAFTHSQGWRTDKHPRMLADVNGDGLMDIIGMGNSATTVYVSTGTTFEHFATLNNEFHYKHWEFDNEPRTAQDLNGDGMADLIGFSGDGKIRVAYATGTGFGPTHTVWTGKKFTSKHGWTGNKNPRHFADVNGDGLPDLVGYADKHISVNLNNNADRDRGHKADVIVKVTDGYGDPLEITYKTMIHGTSGLKRTGMSFSVQKGEGPSNGGWSSKMSTAMQEAQYSTSKTYSYPQKLTNMTSPMVAGTVLRNRLAKADKGQNVETVYSYKNYVSNVNGLGTEGFSHFTSKNIETGAYIQEEFHQAFPLTGRPLEKITYDANGGKQAGTKFSYKKISNMYGVDNWVKDNLNEQRTEWQDTFNGWDGQYEKTNSRKWVYGTDGFAYRIEDRVRGNVNKDKNVYKCQEFLMDENNWLIYLPTEERTQRDTSCRFGTNLIQGRHFGAKRLTYNSYGEMTKQRIILGNNNSKIRISEYFYDEHGALTEMRDANNRKMTYKQDNDTYGHMFNVGTCNHLNHCDYKSYHYSGQVNEQTGITGVKAKYDIDNFGRTSAIYGSHPTKDEMWKMREVSYSRPGQNAQGVLAVKTYIRKDFTGDMNTISRGTNSLFEHEFISGPGNTVVTKKSGKKVGQTKVWEVEYNSAGQIVKTYTVRQGDKGGLASTNEYYPGSARIKKTTGPDGTYVNFSYEDLGLTSIQNLPSPNGSGRIETRTEKTLKGSVIKKGMAGRYLNYTFHADGKPKDITDAMGRRTTFEYYASGQIRRTCRPDSGCNSATYNNDGTVASTTNAKGERTTFSYDSIGRTIQTRGPNGTTKNYYDQDGGLNTGKLTRTDHSDGAISQFRYNRDGDVSIKSTTLPNGVKYVTSVNDEGNTVLPTGDIISHGYERGQANEVFLNGKSIAKVEEWDHEGNGTEVKLGNGLRVVSTFDEFGRPRVVRTNRTNGSYLHYQGFKYNSAGKMEEVNRGDLNEKREYRYDQYGRLIDSKISRGSNETHNRYEFDNNDNLTKVINMGKGSSTNKCATLYQHSRYRGKQYKFCPGQNSPSLSVWNDDASSLSIPSGGTLKVCEHGDGSGWCETYTSNSDWIGSAKNDKISYVEFSIDNCFMTSRDKGGCGGSGPTNYSFAEGTSRVDNVSGGDGPISYSYDNAGNVTRKTKGGKNTDFTYKGGQLTKIEGPNGTTTLGRTRIDPDGTKTTNVQGITIVERPNGNVTHSINVSFGDKRIMALTRSGRPNLMANKIRHNTYKLQAGLFDPASIMGAYGIVKSKVLELLSRENIVNELLIGSSFVFAIGLMLAMIVNIFRKRFQGKIKWWHYPMLVLFFTVSLTLPVSAMTMAPGENGPGNLEVGETYFHTGYLGGTEVTSNGEGKDKNRVSYDSYGKLLHATSGSKDNFAAKGFGKAVAPGHDGIVFHGMRLFDQDSNRFMSPDPV
ncbi:FG-GAP-like repeat-containing protein, partial [Bacteriovoracales bacterium]|nr:FG-GAP-like repeat-containing protein [Bacteriovoracales bacterium]